MAVWLIRAGSHGEHEQKFIQENGVYVTWDGLNVELGHLNNRDDLFDEITQRYQDAKPKTVANWVSQIWPFAHEIKNGDSVVLPLKSQRAIQIGEVTGDYHFDSRGAKPVLSLASCKMDRRKCPACPLWTRLAPHLRGFSNDLPSEAEQRRGTPRRDESFQLEARIYRGSCNTAPHESWGFG